jgi:hypothetical protein
MAIGGDSWGVVVRNTFVEVVQTDNKHVRAKSEGAANLPVLPEVVPTSAADTTIQQISNVAAPSSGRESSRSRPSPSKDGGALSKYLSRSQRGSWCARLCSAVGQKSVAEEDGGQRLQDLQDLQNSLAGSRGKRRQNAVQLPVLLQASVPEQQLLAKKEDVQAHEQDHEANQSPTFSWDDALEEELGSKNEVEENRTTVVITDIASSCTRDGLLAQLDEAGLAGQYDFVYLPVSFETLATHGYGIVNFVTSQAAQMLMQSSPQSVSFSDQRQGLEGHVTNFQDSSLMHEGVPDQFKPVLFKDGRRVPFPAPTRPTRMPRELKRAIWRMKNGELAVDSSPSQVSDVLTPSSQMDQFSPCSSRTPNDRRGGRTRENSRRARSRRDRGSCA